MSSKLWEHFTFAQGKMPAQKQRFMQCMMYCQQDVVERVLLVDAENTCNSTSRKVMLRNISIICPIIVYFKLLFGTGKSFCNTLKPPNSGLAMNSGQNI